MPTIAIVYHSETGRTKQMAEAIARGVIEAGCTVTLVSTSELPSGVRAAEGGWQSLHGADAIVMGCPTYMGTVTADFKRFMDESGNVWFTQGWRDKVAAGFSHSGGLSGDKLNTLVTMAVFAAQHGMQWANVGILPNQFEEGLNRLGSYLGLMSQSDQKDDPPAEDIRTGEAFGRRLAEITCRWCDR
ncbi:MAG: flavodoxin family protein [Planctomycetota bacterium]